MFPEAGVVIEVIVRVPDRWWGVTSVIFTLTPC
jgi:hypothetical protein